MADFITLIVIAIIYYVSKKFFKSYKDLKDEASRDFFLGKISYEEYYKIWEKYFDHKMKFK